MDLVLMKSEMNFCKAVKVYLNEAGYTAQDAPSMRLCVLFTFENNTGRTYGPMDRRTDTTSYRDATAHLKMHYLLQWWMR